MNKIDKSVFLPVYIVLLFISGLIILFPQESALFLTGVQTFIMTQFGFIYIWYGLFAFLFVLWIILSKYGKIMLGEEGDKPEFKRFSWAAMLFCAGIGAGVIYWGAIEWVYYFKAPPFGLEVGSFEAAEMSIAYGIFHWGPVAWSIYSVSACAIGYLYYVRKVPVLKVSCACEGALGRRMKGPLSSVINVAFMLGLLGATATSLGIGAPLATAGLAQVLNIEITRVLELSIIAVITVIFATSSYLGLKKGIKILSDVNVLMTFVLLIFIFIAGNTVFALNIGTTAIGVMGQNFIRMSSWLDPVGQTQFPQTWTVFYWAWWGAYAPFMGMFIAKISRGRTIRNMLMGAIGYGSAGCAMFFIIFGSFGLELHLSGTLDVVSSLSAMGGPQTVIAIFEQLPFSTFGIGLIAVISIVFMSTTFDSASYVLAAVSQKQLRQDEDPLRWLRLLWAFSLALVPVGFMLMNSPLQVLQTVSIVAALPVSIIVIITAVSFVKMVNRDAEDGKINL